MKGADPRRGPGSRAHKTPAEVRDLARATIPGVVERLQKIVMDSDNEQAVCAAARLLWEHGYGKPTTLIGEDPEARFGAQRQAVEDVRAQLLEEMAGGALPPASTVPALEAAPAVAVTGIVSSDGDLDADDLDDDE